MSSSTSTIARVAVIGGGPAGLMAAEVLSGGGVQVDLYDAMPSVGRKFLLAGKGGMNITHAEPYADFVQRYGARSDSVTPWPCGIAPPESPVPAPRATTGTSSRWQVLRTACTCS